VIGNLTAVRLDGFIMVPNTPAACGLFVDHLIGGNQTRRLTEAGKPASSKK
jgi:hypothetical protein